MTDNELIDRLGEIIDILRAGNREQAEVDLADLYDEVANEYDDYEDEDDYSDEDEDDWDDEDEDEYGEE